MITRNKPLLFFFALLSLLLGACSKSSHPVKTVSKLSGDPVLYWNEIAYEAFGGAQYQHSLMASRINAMMHLAIHDAVNGIESRYARFAFQGRDEKADPLAAVAAAAYTVLKHEIPGRAGFLDSAYAAALTATSSGEKAQKGIALGTLAGQAILARRSNDGAGANPVNPIAPSDLPGVYQHVPPFDFAFALHWENLPPFSLERKDQFRCTPMPALNSPAYADAFQEVKSKGQLNSGTRTADQTAYAQFWYEFSEAGWNRIARLAAKERKLNLLETARLFALVDMAIADAYIAGWDSKLHYNFWRPYTAIRKAQADGNEATEADGAWQPLMPTPPIHDYPSTHSALGNAAATVLASLLGDGRGFTLTSPTSQPAGMSRSFPGFRAAANENADSRVQAGIHFRFSCVAGQKLGDDIGYWVVSHALLPLD